METKKVHGLGKDEEEEEESLPGFRFHPTDEELVRFYLRRKVEKRPLSIELIKQIDIYKYDPWDLPKMGNVGDKEWYFYCLRGRKYKNSIRPNRVTGHGFWKATGIDRPIYSQGERSNECIGLKKSLVYYRGSAGKGTKTDWMMHEFRLPTEDAGKSTNVTNLLENTQEVEVWTICRIFKRIASYNKYVPELSDSSLSKLKRNTTELSSITYSSDTDARHEQYNHVQGAKMEYMGGKSFDHVEEQNKPLIRSQLWSLGQASLTTSYSSYPTPNAGTFQRNENWDELGAVVEFALDPSTVHGCSHSL